MDSIKEIFQKYKNYFYIGGLVVAGSLAYFYWQSSQTPDSLEYTGETVQSDEEAGRSIITALESLRVLKIDPAVYDHPVLGTLVDHRLSTSTEDRGRVDPFAPVTGATSTKKN